MLLRSTWSTLRLLRHTISSADLRGCHGSAHTLAMLCPKLTQRLARPGEGHREEQHNVCTLHFAARATRLPPQFRSSRQASPRTSAKTRF